MKEKGKGIDLRVFEFQGALQQTNNEYRTVFNCFFTKHHKNVLRTFLCRTKVAQAGMQAFPTAPPVLRNTERMQAFFPGDAKSLAIHTNFSARCFS